MKNDKALNVMEYIDSNMIDEAEVYKVKKKNNTWIKWGAVAACLCICLVGAKLYPALHDPINGTEAGYGVEESDSSVPGDINNFERPVQENAAVDSDVLGQVNTGMMIGHYDKSLNDADIAVYNGHYELSESLKAALDEYGDTVNYRVVVEVFKDGTVISSGSSEVASEEARLANEKYTVAHETYEDTVEHFDYFTIHAEANQLLHFSVNKSYGYYISLYDEYLGLKKTSEDTDAVYNAPANTVDVPVDESNPGFMQATEYPAEVLEIQQELSDAMARGDIPYVNKSAICENPLRIEVYVTTTDEKVIKVLKSKYDPTGQYIVVKQSKGCSQEE